MKMKESLNGLYPAVTYYYYYYYYYYYMLWAGVAQSV